MEIYAEITRKTLREMENGATLDFPNRVVVNRKNGSRALFIECDDDMKEELIDFLDKKNINWQEN